MENRDVIIACDFASAEETLRFLERFGDERPFLKIGMELYYAEGPRIVTALKERGHGVFLDLKLHDIPNTVKKAMRVLSGLGADIVNLHAAGTRAMMEAALEGLSRPDGSRPKLIAVTILTSMDEEQFADLNYKNTIAEQVVALAKLAKAAGLDGVVASPKEAAAIRQACGPDFLIVTPGVRPAGSALDDQSRVATPARAFANGSSHIVVGRPIMKAADRRQAALEIVEEIKSIK